MVPIWLFEKKGFISVVAYDPSKDREKTSPFPAIAKQAGTHVLVRARILEDLDHLKEMVPSLVIDTQPNADYSFRAVVTRAKFKRYMNRIVDEITYDSHFKEACRDAAPPATGRYGALMDVWSTMAKLQPFIPYSGASRKSGKGSGTGYQYGSTHSDWSSDDAWWESGYDNGQGKTKSYVSPFGIDAANKKKADKDVKDKTPKDVRPYRLGQGDLSGLSIGDRVRGFFGIGEVTKVESRGTDKADLVTVKSGSKYTPTTGQFLSNFLIKEDFPKDPEPVSKPIVAEVTEDPDTADENLVEWVMWDLDDTYEYLCDHPEVHDFPSEDLAVLDDDSFELVTRLQEKYDGKVSREDLNTAHDEVYWESLDEDGKRAYVREGGTPPEKHLSEAMSFLDDEVEKIEKGS